MSQDTRTADGIYLIVFLGLDWSNPDLFDNYQSVIEFALSDGQGNTYQWEGFPQTLDATYDFMRDDPLRVDNFNNGARPFGKPYVAGTVLHDLIVYDVPASTAPLYLTRGGFPRLIIRVR